MIISLKRVYFIILLFLVFLGLIFPSKALSYLWPTYRSDITHSGLSNFALEDVNPLRWASPDLGLIKYPPIVSSDGYVYIPTSTGIQKLDQAGKKVWFYSTGSESTLTPAIDNSGNIYFGTNTCFPVVYSLSSNGALRWKYNLYKPQDNCGVNQARSPVTLSTDQTTLYVGVSYPEQKVYAFSSADGGVKWTKSLDGNDTDRSSITVGPDNNLYVGSGSYGTLYSLTPNGDFRWTQGPESGGSISLNTPVFASDGNIYVTSNGVLDGDYLVSFTPSGTKRWVYKVSGSSINYDIAVSGGIVYLPEKTNLRAINVSSGNLIWKWTADTNKDITSPVVDKNGVIYVSSYNKIYSINPDGTTKSSLIIPDGSDLWSPIIADNGLILVFQKKLGVSPIQGYIHALGTPPSDKVPVIFIPGIGGSEFKASQDIIWSKDNGHGGIFDHAYPSGEKIWVNQNEAVKLGNDDYFDVLKLKPDGLTPEAPGLGLNGNLSSFGYGEIDSFFKNAGYLKDKNFFVFPYDWRKDVRLTESDLDSLIETAKQKSGKDKINLVAHSMGGLVARNYITNTSHASKVNKLIELGVPHLGSVYALKTLMYGTWLARDLYLIKLGIVPSEIKDIFANLTTGFILNPSLHYFDFYNDSTKLAPLPFSDDRDIDKDSKTGSLNYLGLKTLLTNLGYNQTTFNQAEQFHSSSDNLLTQLNGVKLYLIVGSSQPTLGQIRETYWVKWPIDFIPRREEIFINGDDTVPLYSASLKSDNLDLSAGAKIYYVEQRHSDLVRENGTAMLAVKSILGETDLPVDVKDTKFTLSGNQILIDKGNIDIYDDQNYHTGLDSNGELETNLEDTTYSSIEDSTTVFIKDLVPFFKIVLTSTSDIKPSLSIKNYSQDNIVKTIFYKDLPLKKNEKTEYIVDRSEESDPVININGSVIKPTSIVEGETSADTTPPITKVSLDGKKDESGNFTSSVLVTLTPTDKDSGISLIEYSLDNGKAVKNYTQPFNISTLGLNTLQVKSTDKLGNEESPQIITFKILSPSTLSTPTPSSTTTSSNTSSNSTGSTSNNSNNSPAQNNLSLLPAIVTNVKSTITNILKSLLSSANNQNSQEVLGAKFATEDKIQKNIPEVKTADEKLKQLITVTAIIGGVLGLSLVGSFFYKPTPE